MTILSQHGLQDRVMDQSFTTSPETSSTPTVRALPSWSTSWGTKGPATLVYASWSFLIRAGTAATASPSTATPNTRATARQNPSAIYQVWTTNGQRKKHQDENVLALELFWLVYG